MTRPFDVFLCHNSEDKPFVREIAQQLRDQKLAPWLDEEQLVPGEIWSEAVDQVSKEIAAVAVFVGANGFGPWQKAEIAGFLQECVDRKIRVIPVLLENAPEQPNLPFFLRGRTWIDFRQSHPNPLELLLWGIRGTREPPQNPSPSVVPEAQQRPTLATSLRSDLDFFDFEWMTVDRKGAIAQRTPQAAQYFVEPLGNDVELEMVAIPAGTFTMGSSEGEAERYSDESPQHAVTLPGFYMGKFAVTQAQYQLLMGNNPSQFRGEKRPVERVSWEEAIVFCQKLSNQTGKRYRLPSEAEWEYACRAGTTTPFHCGETITTELANFNGASYGAAPKGVDRQQTLNVGIFPPNEFGLYDMHGNVLEWCHDHWHGHYQDAPSDGSVWGQTDAVDQSLRVLRGGSWLNMPRNCRSAVRFKEPCQSTINIAGFRVVCDEGCSGLPLPNPTLPLQHL